MPPVTAEAVLSEGLNKKGVYVGQGRWFGKGFVAWRAGAARKLRATQAPQHFWVHCPSMSGGHTHSRGRRDMAAARGAPRLNLGPRIGRPVRGN